MSKSRKKQQARKRETATREGEALEHHVHAAPLLDAEEDERDDTPALALPEKREMPLDQALFDRVVATATRAGVMREEGDRLVYLYNGDTVALKFVEPGEGADEPARILVAAFRQGVVYQVEGDRQVVYRPGPWEAALDQLADAPDEESDEDVSEEG